MKKIILIILLLVLNATNVSAKNLSTIGNYSCGTESECYQDSLYIDSEGDTIIYYAWKNSVVQIKMPYSLDAFIKLEHEAFSWRINENHFYYQSIMLNQMLRIRGLELLVY